jgi:hypothetical protein
VEQDTQNRTVRTGQPEKTARTEARTVQPGRDRQNSTARIGKPEQESQNRKTGQSGQDSQDSKNRSASTGQQ